MALSLLKRKVFDQKHQLVSHSGKMDQKTIYCKTLEDSDW